MIKEFFTAIFYGIMIVLGAAMGCKEFKGYKEFKSGLKKHEHEFERKPYEIQDWRYNRTHWHKCKHLGCNLVNPVEYLTDEGKRLHGPDWEAYAKEFGYELTPEPRYSDIKITYQ